MRVRTFAVVVTAMLALAGCDWAQLGWSAQRNNASPDTAISTSNVGNLHLVWQSASSPNVGDGPPSIAGGVAFVARNGGHLDAYDASGNQGCAGTPRTCSPLRTYVSPAGPAAFQTPAIVGNTLFSSGLDVINGQVVWAVYAFDATGHTNCSGTPTTCTPTWVGPSDGLGEGAVAIAGNRVFVGGDRTVRAFDVSGTGCAPGTPPVCSPVWTGTVPSGMFDAQRIAVSGNTVFAGVSRSSDGSPLMLAFDGAGGAGCAGTPPTCAPEWSYAGGAVPAISGSRVYSGGVFDAAGQQNCSGTPKVCTALFSTGGTAIDGKHGVAAGTAPDLPYRYVVQGYDATGAQGCSGVPKTCGPLWTGVLDATPGNAETVEGTTLANGVAYASTRGTHMLTRAFDAAGNVGCAGTPKVCTPLWSAPFGAVGNPVVANGTVYLFDGAVVRAFRP